MDKYFLHAQPGMKKTLHAFGMVIYYKAAAILSCLECLSALIRADKLSVRVHVCPWLKTFDLECLCSFIFSKLFYVRNSSYIFISPAFEAHGACIFT